MPSSVEFPFVYEVFYFCWVILLEPSLFRVLNYLLISWVKSVFGFVWALFVRRNIEKHERSPEPCSFIQILIDSWTMKQYSRRKLCSWHNKSKSSTLYDFLSSLLGSKIFNLVIHDFQVFCILKCWHWNGLNGRPNNTKWLTINCRCKRLVVLGKLKRSICFRFGSRAYL